METILKTVLSYDEFYDIQKIKRILNQAESIGLKSVEFEYGENKRELLMTCSSSEED